MFPCCFTGTNSKFSMFMILVDNDFISNIINKI